MTDDKVQNNGQERPEEEPTPEKLMASTSAEATTDEAAVADEDSEDGTSELTLEERLEEAEGKAAEYLEGWQRARAEFANARKRLERERVEARRNATIEVVGSLIPILDDFDRALETVPEEIADDSWFEGVALVHRKLRTILDKVNIERIEAVGQPFDPNYHEAVLQEESEEYESGTVIKELQPGYRLQDRVIRPAMVVVAA